jgi:hypothetical protein
MRNTVVRLVAILLFLMPILCFGEKSGIDREKIESFITKVEAFAKSHPTWSDFPEGSPAREEIMAILDSVDEAESLEAQNILTANSDLQEINYKIHSGNLTEDEILKFMTYSFIEGRLFAIWKDQTGNIKEVLMQKVLPVIRSDKYNPNLKKSFLVHARRYMGDMHNKKINFPDNDRDLFMDELVNIFTDDTQSLNLRCKAARTWVGFEKRKDVFWEKFKYLKENPLLFEASAYDMAGNMFVDRNSLKERMFMIVEEGENIEIVRGGLRYLEAMVSGKADERKKLKERIRKIRDKETREQLKNVYNEYLR